MPNVRTTIDIKATDEMRVRPRMGGGFHVLIGSLAGADVMISFETCAKAEAVAALLTTAAITHGDLGAAVASVVNALTDPSPRKPKGPRLALVQTDPTDNPPPAAA